MTDKEKEAWKLMVEALETGERFRATPIVDDDFEEIRDEFDFKLQQALRVARGVEKT